MLEIMSGPQHCEGWGWHLGKDGKVDCSSGSSKGKQPRQTGQVLFISGDMKSIFSYFSYLVYGVLFS